MTLQTHVLIVHNPQVFVCKQPKWREAYNPVRTICGQNHFSRPKRAMRPKLQCGFMSSKYGILFFLFVYYIPRI
jgi:hypothetical protein